MRDLTPSELAGIQTNASDVTESERASIIDLARELDREAMTEDISGPGKFDGSTDRELALALEIISGHGAADETAGDVETSYGHGARVGRIILWTDTQGFLSTAVYADESEAMHALEIAGDAAIEDDEPSEDDATLSPTGPLGAQTSVSYAGKHLGVFDDDAMAETALAEAMRKASFWPDVWTISDHRNACKISERFYAEHETGC